MRGKFLTVAASVAFIFASCGGEVEEQCLNLQEPVGLPDSETGDVDVDVLWLVDLSGSF